MEALKQACDKAHVDSEFIDKFVRDCLEIPADDKPTIFDYKVVAGVIRLFCNLPASHAATSIVKTLRGNATAAVCKKQPEFGMIAGMKRYGPKLMMEIAYDVEKMLKQVDVTEDDDLRRITSEEYDEGKYNAPDWIWSKLVDKQWGNDIAAAFEECGKANGKDEPVPVAKAVATKDTRPKTLFGKIPHEIYMSARAKAAAMYKKFLLDNPGWEETYGYHSGINAGKSSKDGIITQKFNIGGESQYSSETVRESRPQSASWRERESAPRKRIVLLTKWSDEGDTLDSWDVIWEDMK